MNSSEDHVVWLSTKRNTYDWLVVYLNFLSYVDYAKFSKTRELPMRSEQAKWLCSILVIIIFTS